MKRGVILIALATVLVWTAVTMEQEPKTVQAEERISHTKPVITPYLDKPIDEVLTIRKQTNAYKSEEPIEIISSDAEPESEPDYEDPVIEWEGIFEDEDQETATEGEYQNMEEDTALLEEQTDESGDTETDTCAPEDCESATCDDGEPEEDDGSDWIYIGTWVCTGYCSCELCCGEYASGYTASGTLATEGRTIASNELPIGTVVYIEGMGEYVVEDTGWSPYESWIDIFFESHDSALAFGLQEREVYLIQ
jgi:3D (Asp-Asp-Asp) domain-containing protein